MSRKRTNEEVRDLLNNATPGLAAARLGDIIYDYLNSDNSGGGEDSGLAQKVSELETKVTNAESAATEATQKAAAAEQKVTELESRVAQLESKA
ncbi:hypothetical protein [Morganella phage Mecenats66]|nr:hypothetical protein [Morganella phage Mecenats66]